MRMLDGSPIYHDWRSQDINPKGKKNQTKSTDNTSKL